MYPIPDVILMHFDTMLEKKFVPFALRDDYRRWLRYFLDFRARYHPPDDRSTQVRLFIEKMRSKGRTGKDLHHAAHALSLFFLLQYDKKQSSSPAERIGEALSGAAATRASLPAPGLPASGPTLTPAPLPEGEGVKRRPGRKYNEWWSMERTVSPEWDSMIIDRLAGEIKARHYSRKTLKAYADWSRKFQVYLKHKPPRDLSPQDVKSYLTNLAVTCKVSASTQNQAFNALLFLLPAYPESGLRRP